jgi:hypothetical protein
MFALAFILATAGHSAPATMFWPHINRFSVVSTVRGFFPNHDPVPKITKVVIAAPFAVASFDRGMIESKLYRGQLLLEHFGFGWQVIDVSIDPTFETVELTHHGLPVKTAIALLHGVVRGRSALDSCAPSRPACYADSGTAEDIEAIRKNYLPSQDEAIGPVVVRSGYAMAEWSGNGGGEGLFRKRLGRWQQISGGGGAMCMADLLQMHVPLATAKFFMTSTSFACGSSQ